VDRRRERIPTAPGVNPMVSIMSLAHRTAQQILSS
jgi:choline dehydrogenase-like flavoprotein